MNAPLAFGRNFLPGPVDVHPHVLAALTRPMMSHRSPAADALHAELQRGLRDVFRTTRPVVIGTCSASAMMDAAIRTGVQDRVLCVVGGYFGERWAQIAESLGRTVLRARVPEGETLEPAHLEAFLDGPDVEAVTIVHSETATGALAPLEALARVVRARPPVRLLVDAVTSLGGSPVETDAWGLDFVFTGSQKALGLPPGLALGVASARFLEAAAGIDERGWYLDLVRMHAAAEAGHFAPTPALPQVQALAAQLARIEAAGGVEAWWARHAARRALVEAWAERREDVRLLARAERRAWTCAALALPDGVAAGGIVSAMAERGYLLTDGLGARAAERLRFGFMGDMPVEALDGMLGHLGDVLDAVRVPV